MTTIWKFEIKGGLVDFKQCDTNIMVPLAASVLSAGLDPAGKLCVWMLVESEAEKVVKRVYVRGAGHDCGDVDVGAAEFIGTVLQSSYVWHVFIGDAS